MCMPQKEVDVSSCHVFLSLQIASESSIFQYTQNVTNIYLKLTSAALAIMPILWKYLLISD
jgi:hypothetical protein